MLQMYVEDSHSTPPLLAIFPQILGFRDLGFREFSKQSWDFLWEQEIKKNLQIVISNHKMTTVSYVLLLFHSLSQCFCHI